MTNPNLVRRLPASALLSVCWLVAGAAALAQNTPTCEPSPAVKAALDQLPSFQNASQTDWQFHELRQSAIQALLRQYPDDVFVKRADIPARSYPNTDRDKVVAEYKALHEQHPDDARIDYLYGLTLVGRDSPQAVKVFNAALEKDPSFPYPRLELVHIFSSPNFLDKAQAESQVKTFISACPATFDGYEPLARMDNRPLIAESAQKLRQVIGSRTDPEALGAYTTLWSLEFKAHPPSEYGPLRQQVAADLSRIRALNRENERRWYEALTEGYKLVNDQKQSDWAGGEGARRFPSAYNLPERSKWEKDHQYPGDDTPADKKQAYYSDLLKQTDEWTRERPNTTYIWMERLDALEHLDNTSAADVQACLDRVMQVAEANAGPQPLDSYVYFSVAEVLSKKHLQPDREVEMASKGLDQLAAEVKQPPYDLYATPKDIDDQNFYNANQRAQGVFYEADGYLQLSNPEKAQASLDQLDTSLQQLKSQAGDKDDRRKSVASTESTYWGGLARLAELQSRKTDAMAYYESALLARLDSGQLPAAGEKDELLEGARQLWTSLGGTDKGWKSWYGKRADALASQSHLTWESANDPLPAFELTDLKGKTWQLADLKGKVVFLNFWASW
jgi:AhpC/TSA family